MSTYKWIGPKAEMKLWNHKKDMTDPLWGYKVIRIDFGLHGLAYTYLHGSLVQLKTGEWVKVFVADLTTPGRVIGAHDAETAKNKPWAEEWRFTFHERNLDRLGLS